MLSGKVAVNGYYSYVLPFSRSFISQVSYRVSLAVDKVAVAAFPLAYKRKSLFCFSCLFNLMTVVVRKMLHYEIVQNLMPLDRINNCLYKMNADTVSVEDTCENFTISITFPSEEWKFIEIYDTLLRENVINMHRIHCIIHKCNLHVKAAEVRLEIAVKIFISFILKRCNNIWRFQDANNEIFHLLFIAVSFIFLIVLCWPLLSLLQKNFSRFFLLRQKSFSVFVFNLIEWRLS